MTKWEGAWRRISYPYTPHPSSYRSCQAPALAIIGENDAVIRPNSYLLLEQWNRPYELHIIPEGDHYSIYEDDHSWQAVSSFIEKIIELDESGNP